jgi:hypothetical protein
MKNIYKIIILIAIVGLSFNTATAQNTFAGISYNMGYTLGNTNDYVDDYSWRGFGFELRSFIESDISVGMSFGWSVFDEKVDKSNPKNVIQLDNGAVSGTQIRYVNTFPIMANFHYYFSKNTRDMSPYVGLSAGGVSVSQNIDINIYTFEASNWHFMLAPEAGIILPMDFGNFYFNAKYNYAFASGETLSGKSEAYTYLSFGVGVCYYY